MRQHQLQGAIYCLIATASWGAMFPVMTGALVRIDPFTFTSLRYLIAGAAFLAVLIFKEGWSAVHFKEERMLAAWLFGTAGFAGFNFLMFLGQKMIGKEGALVASIIAATMPMLGLLVNWAVSKAKPSIYSFLFISLSFCGVALVVTKGHFAGLVDSSPNFLADVLMILGALHIRCNLLPKMVAAQIHDADDRPEPRQHVGHRHHTACIEAHPCAAGRRGRFDSSASRVHGLLRWFGVELERRQQDSHPT